MTAIRDRIKHLEALRDDTMPEADLSAELWGRQKAKRPTEEGKPDLFTRHKVCGRRRCGLYDEGLARLSDCDEDDCV